MKKRLTNYFEDTLAAPEIATHILADVPVNYVPTALSAIETRKGRSFWLTRDDWSRALDALNLFQERLLMDASDRIVSEVRALRNGTGTPPEARDPQLDPYTLPLVNLGEMNWELYNMRLETRERLDTANATLIEVRDAILAGSPADQGMLDKLDTLIFLLGAV